MYKYLEIKICKYIFHLYC